MKRHVLAMLDKVAGGSLGRDWQEVLIAYEVLK